MEKVNSSKRLLFIVISFLLLVLLSTLYFFFIRPMFDGENSDPLDDDFVSLDVSNRILEEYASRIPTLEVDLVDNPNDASLIREYAVALYATGDLEGAKIQYEKELEINSSDPVLYNNLGNVYRYSGEHQKAIEMYERSLDLDPVQVNAYSNLANLLIFTLDDLDKGIKVYERAAENNSDGRENFMLLMASAYEQKGFMDEAIKKYNEILSYNEQYSAALAALERLKQ